MNELIHIQSQLIGNELTDTVNARELHTYLESKQDFSNWINNRIKQYGFVENTDYLLHKIIVQVPSGKKYKNEYFLTLGMAKELAMVERSDKGKLARKYFIECEIALKQVAPRTYAEALRALAEKAEQLDKLALERDEAIKTKHFINDKKVASALGKAGAKSKELNQMKNSFGVGKDKASINAVYVRTGLKYKWHALKQWCEDNDVEAEQINEYAYGLIKLYPAQAWLDVYDIDLTKLF